MRQKTTVNRFLVSAAVLIAVLSLSYFLILYIQPPRFQGMMDAQDAELIAESFRIAVPSALDFLSGAMLAGLFLWQFLIGRGGSGVLYLAAIAFLRCIARIASAPFAGHFIDPTLPDLLLHSRYLTITALLAYFSLKSGRLRPVIRGIVFAMGAAFAVSFVLDWVRSGPAGRIEQVLIFRLPQYIGYFSLWFVIVTAVIVWRKSSYYYQRFAWTEIALLGGHLLVLLISAPFGATWLRAFVSHLWPIFGMEFISFHLWRLLGITVVAALIAAAIEVIHSEVEHRTMDRIMRQQGELAMRSYDELRAHDQEVMMLRHDMVRHLTLLQQGLRENPDKAVAYIDELIGQNQEIRPVIFTGNRLADVLLNGRLSDIRKEGVTVNVVRAEAPASLPVTDPDACSLLLNLLDNAQAALAAPGLKEKWLRLDMHIKNGFWVIRLENAAAPRPAEDKKEETVPKHGLGLQIIRRITQRAGGHMSAEPGEDRFTITVALPMTNGEAAVTHTHTHTHNGR